MNIHVVIFVEIMNIVMAFDTRFCTGFRFIAAKGDRDHVLAKIKSEVIAPFGDTGDDHSTHLFTQHTPPRITLNQMHRIIPK